MTGEDIHGAPPPDRAAPTRRGGGRVLLWMVAIIVLGVVVTVVWRRDRRNPAGDGPPTIHVQQLTDMPGEEAWPNVSPDGRWILYVSSASGNEDIYLQAVGGHNPKNLTGGSAADDTTPRFSPDGEEIVFRSERQGGGLFVMGRAGTPVRRLTDEGHDPDWSPDGTKVVYATVGVIDPAGQATGSRLRVVDVAGGERRRLDVPDAVQPRWSPDGRFIAYWRAGSRPDIGTVMAEGGDPVMITENPPLDWSPAWSADGRYIYFASDRSGDMNLWRVPIETATGGAAGDPEPMTVPSPWVGQIALSSDGRRIVYQSVMRAGDLRSPVEGDIWMATLGSPAPAGE